MILIIGGAYQGKRAYATETLGCPEERIIGQVECRIRAMLDAGLDPMAEVGRLAKAEWADAVLLLEDISSGIVPLDAADRAWREAVGRCGAFLARQSERVIRVFCGIGTVIKDA